MAKGDEGNTIKTIKNAARNRKLPKVFNAADLRAIGIHPRTAAVFTAKHCKGNPGDETVHFERVGNLGSGNYRLISN